MQGLDINDSSEKIKSRIKSLQEYRKISSDFKKLKQSLGDSTQESKAVVSEQLNKAKELKKRFEKETKKTIDQLLEFLTMTKGNGPETFKYLRRKLFQVVVKITPEIQEILINETIKVLGCSQEQTYIANNAIYIPVKSIDIFGNLKNSPESDFGKVYYENKTPSTDTSFIPYGGRVHFPMNKTLYSLMDENNAERSFEQIYGKKYQGKTLQPLFDITYTTTGEFGETGDFYKVVLSDRLGSGGNILNTVGGLLGDYYSTIKIVDPVDITAQLVNVITGAIDINTNIGYDQLETKSKFQKIVERILGLCFDSRTEIDVSGTAKVAELDGVDESFYRLTNVDLRNIEQSISNIQNGVMEFVDCDNLKLPVDSQVLINDLQDFREKIDGLSDEDKTQAMEDIIDNISENPNWQFRIPSNFNVGLTINKNLLKQLPLAVMSSLISPKVLLPIYVLLSELKNTSQNSISNPDDFMNQFKKFNIEVISKIGAIFVKALFEELKKDILQLISVIITDINKAQVTKKITMILGLVNIAIVVAQLITDYRKCKSILDDILNLLNLINSVGRTSIPFPLLSFAPLLPGISAERSTINAIENLQSVGIPTGPLPDGSPNLMALFNLATNKGFEKEFSQNAKIEAFGVVPPLTGGYVKIFGKPV